MLITHLNLDFYVLKYTEKYSASEYEFKNVNCHLKKVKTLNIILKILKKKNCFISIKNNNK